MSKRKTNTAKPSRQPEAAADKLWYGYLPVAAAVILFLTGLNNALTGIDDHAATTDNPAVAAFTVQAVFSQFNLGMYAPFTWIFYAIAHGLGGESPVWYHLFSLVAHAASTWLVFRLMRRLNQSEAVSAGVAFIFAAHPMQVESVSWVAAFSTPLFSLLYLLALNRYLQYAAAPDTGRRHYFAALLFLVASCLAKSTAVTLPLTLLVLDWWKRPALSVRQRWMGYLPFFAVSLGFGMLTVYGRSVSGEGIRVFEEYNLFDRFLMANYALVSYIGNFLAPFRLSSFYTFEKINGAWPMAYYLAPVLVAGTLVFAWLKRNSLPFLAQGLGFYLSAIVLSLPWITVGTFDLFADHYNYLAIIGLAFPAVQGVRFLKEKFPAVSGILSIVGVVWLVWLVALCFVQIKTWRGMLAVTTNAIEKGNTAQGKAYFWRAVEHGDLGQMDPAVEDFTRAIEANPEIWDAYKFRGSIYAQRRDFARAVPDLQKYLEHDPNDAVSWFNMGMIQIEQSRPAEAAAAFTNSLKVRPNAIMVLENRARAYQMLGDTGRAEADRQTIQQLKGR